MKRRHFILGLAVVAGTSCASAVAETIRWTGNHAAGALQGAAAALPFEWYRGHQGV